MFPKKLKAAIIDSGVRKDHPRFLDDDIIGFHFSESIRDNNFEDSIGHGTAIYGIMREAAPFCEITNIKIVEEDDCVDEETLIGVLEYIYQHQKFNLINISASISICSRYDRLKNICEKLKVGGTILVSSFDNTGSMSYPAAFDSVIGVTSDAYCHLTSDISFVENSPVNIGAKGSVQRLCWKSPDYVLLGGNSFACAHVSVEILKLLNEGDFDFNNCRESLRMHAKYIYSFPNPQRVDIIPNKIRKAALFPFNKEMHSLIRFSELLNFEIVDVYDVRYSGHVGADTDHVLNEKCNSNFKIKNVDLVDWSCIDTFILGHTDELSNATNSIGLKKELLEQACASNTFVYAFDDLTSLLSNMSVKPKVYFPKISVENMPSQAFSKLFRISKPVLGIFGTSSRQGKFTLQLTLRRKFMKAGYTIGQIGTEPSSLLYGMDSVFPMGYNASVSLKEFDVIHFLNNEMNKLCLKDVDLIIVGSQSGTVSYDMSNLERLNLKQYEFLLGTQPDCVILCINPYDKVDLLERSVRFIESSIGCHVIALVMFPMDFKNNFSGIYGGKRSISHDEFNEKKELINRDIDLPIYLLNKDEDIVELANKVISFFQP